MPWWTWAALAFFLAVSLVTVLLSVAFAIRTVRSVRAARTAATGALDDLFRAADELDRRVAAVNAGSEEVQAHVARLNRSARKLSVLLTALGDVRTAVGTVTGVVPRRK